MLQIRTRRKQEQGAEMNGREEHKGMTERVVVAPTKKIPKDPKVLPDEAVNRENMKKFFPRHMSIIGVVLD